MKNNRISHKYGSRMAVTEFSQLTSSFSEMKTLCALSRVPWLVRGAKPRPADDGLDTLATLDFIFLLLRTQSDPNAS